MINFCQQKIRKAAESSHLLTDYRSYVLIWEYLLLLLRQNGTIVGTDVAELLLNDHDILQEPVVEVINCYYYYYRYCFKIF